MQDLYPGAKWRPYGTQDNADVITPRVLITHTMVGYLAGTEAMFRANGYKGVGSHFGLGGPGDGINDGILYQWQLLSRQAYAQFGGNAHGISVETSDAGNPDTPWSNKQLDTLTKLHVWFCNTTGMPAKPATSATDSGFGYHSMFNEWNITDHACPGTVRIGQLRDVVWPNAFHIVNSGQLPTEPHTVPTTFPVFPLPDGWYFGPVDGPEYSVSGFHGHSSELAVWQRQMRARGWYGMPNDGLYGPLTAIQTKRFQTEKGLTPDGLIGKNTWDAAWHSPVT